MLAPGTRTSRGHASATVSVPGQMFAAGLGDAPGEPLGGAGEAELVGGLEGVGSSATRIANENEISRPAGQISQRAWGWMGPKARSS